MPILIAHNGAGLEAECAALIMGVTWWRALTGGKPMKVAPATPSTRMTGALRGKSRGSLVPRVDVVVNEAQPSGMIESSERTVIDQVVDRLVQKFPGVPGAKVTDVVNACYARFDGRPVRDFVPLFVERGARSQLTQISGV